MRDGSEEKTVSLMRAPAVVKRRRRKSPGNSEKPSGESRYESAHSEPFGFQMSETGATSVPRPLRRRVSGRIVRARVSTRAQRSSVPPAITDCHTAAKLVPFEARIGLRALEERSTNAETLRLAP